MTREEFLKAALAAATAARDVGAPINPVIAAVQAGHARTSNVTAKTFDL